jgi:hypothetical protein
VAEHEDIPPQLPMPSEEKSTSRAVGRPEATVSDRAIQIYLERLQAQNERELVSTKNYERGLAIQEQIIFGALLIAGLLALGVGVLGVYLAFVDQLTLGLVSEAVGLISGAGSYGLWKMEERVARRRDEQIASLRAERAFDKATHDILMIDDRELRNQLLAERVSSQLKSSERPIIESRRGESELEAGAPTEME